ncbi:MAG: hypothetical protein J5896_01440 [Alphaproteobacteria bacterium]|nr:hypothetical protein [Alphaproteobacteria bacterium]
MAEEEIKQITREDCEALYALLTKKELSEDEQRQVKETIEKSPNILTDKEFSKYLALPDLAFEYTTPEELPALIEKNKQAVDNMKQVLDNLSDVEGLTIKGKKCAAYLLDNMRFDNGEIVGTQLAKNIHFLGTARRKDLISEDDFGQSDTLYTSLYGEENGYGANRNARNTSGQKVSDVMRLAEVLREEKYENVSTVDNVKDQVFMTHADEQRETLNVEEGNRRPMTIEEYEEGNYRGTLTVAQQEEYKKIKEQKKEATMEPKAVDPHRSSDEKKHGNGFKDEDVIKYMYEEWFLAGLSWLFDKAEDCVDMAIDRLLDDTTHRRALRAHEATMARNKACEDFSKKEKFFDAATASREENIRATIANNQAGFAADMQVLKKIDFNNLSDEEQTKLQSKYGEPFIKWIRAAYAKSPEAVRRYLDDAPSGYANTCKTTNQIAKLAARQIKIEMQYEAMKDQKAWQKKKSTEFRDDNDLMAEYDKRCAERCEALSEAVSVIQTDVKSTLTAGWRSVDKNNVAQRQNFINENVFKVLDADIQAATDGKEKVAAEERKKRFERAYKTLSDDKLLTCMIAFVSEAKTDAFLTEQAHLTSEAKTLQDNDITKNQYDVNDLRPNKETNKVLEKAADRREKVLKEGANDKKLFPEAEKDINHAKNLLEAALDSDRTKVYTVIANTEIKVRTDSLTARRCEIEARKQKVAEFVKNMHTHPQNITYGSVKEPFGRDAGRS